MFTLRATARLLERLKIAPERQPPVSTTRLGDWYANLLCAAPSQLILCVSERTLLPVILPAEDAASLSLRLALALGEVLREIGVCGEMTAAELAQMNQARVAKTANRRVLGSMNDFAYLLDVYKQGRRSLLDVSLQLAEAPCSPIGMESPRRATLELFAHGPKVHRLH
ncbi:MAG: hypothetical protein HY899_15130 [Deltaproteobacteria bacterium]|nr:hypothetical protein [Deltaproteobacteria bacterium]